MDRSASSGFKLRRDISDFQISSRMGVKHGARWALSWFSSTILEYVSHPGSSSSEPPGGSHLLGVRAIDAAVPGFSCTNGARRSGDI